MPYPALPEHEQIRKRKPLPQWYLNIESVPLGPKPKSAPNEYDGLPGQDAVLRCLKKHGLLSFRELYQRLERKEVSLAGWLSRLQAQGKITFERRATRKYWRLARPGEVPAPVPERKGRHRYIQRQILSLLEPNSERWFTVGELQTLLNLPKVGTITQSLYGLAQSGEVDCRYDPDLQGGTGSQLHRHPYRYRYRQHGNG